jgi:AcrR family transcriptional regulator
MTRRLKPPDRRARILQAAVLLAGRGRGKYLALTRREVARAARVSPALVSHYWGCMPELRKEIMREAIRKEILSIVAQGVGCGCPIATGAPIKLIAKAFRSCLDTSRSRTI